MQTKFIEQELFFIIQVKDYWVMKSFKAKYLQ